MERLKSLQTSGHSPSVDALCNPCFFPLDLDRHFWREKRRCACLRFNEPRRLLLQNLRNGHGSDFDSHIGIEVHARRTRPIRNDSNGWLRHVGGSDHTRFGKIVRPNEQKRDERSADECKIAKYEHSQTAKILTDLSQLTDPAQTCRFRLFIAHTITRADGD